MRRFLVTAMLLCTMVAPAWSQEAQPLDLTHAAQDLKFAVIDFSGRTEDLRFSVIDMGGKTEDLQVTETATEIRIELAADVLFDFDKATIKPEAAAALHSVAEIVTGKGKGRRVRIDGHTDSKGNDAYNQKLSERRAESVKQWLAEKEGLGQVKMTTQGFGASKPVSPNTNKDGSDSPEGRQKNRRVEIVLAK
jgi:outer membrane protein OmpA-like peptidoglycan-associated protein